MRRNCWLAGVAILAAVAWVGWMNTYGRADDKAAPDKADAKADEALTVPKGTNEELLTFIGKVRAMTPPKGEDFKAFVVKSRGAMLEAANKILADKPDGKTRVAAVRAKVESLAILANLAEDAKAAKQLRELVDELQNDKQPELAKFGALVKLQFEVRDLSEGKGTPEDARKLWDEVKGKLVAAPDNKQNIQMAASVAQALGSSKDPKLVKLTIEANRDLGEILSKSKDPQIAEAAKRFEGTARRLALPGHPIELKGTLVDGKPFDPASLKGKVVLVDFWATWCGPCRAELPNVKANYEKYHDKGFDVIGISLDKDRDTLVKFLKDEKIPWQIIYGAEGEPHGWDQSLATYYGIGSIPATILTDKKGNVVSMNARGEKLGELLKELLP